MSLIVQKFGGTSLATVENRLLVAERVKQNIESGNITVVIVSAMGRKGMPYATDSLLNLAKQAYLEISDRESDLLCSCGEVISAVA
ncbi:MAG: aspartate kinase, partial [Candidatus Cloacimonadota bacterium]|nr:aspartate kinase [Candidatus Cloacimonadota bacterium]